MTACRLVAPGGRGLKGIEMEGGVTANRYKVSFWGDENVLELHPWLHNCEYIKTRVTLFKWVNSTSVKLHPPPFLHRAQTTSPPDLNCHQKAEHTPPSNLKPLRTPRPVLKCGFTSVCRNGCRDIPVLMSLELRREVTAANGAWGVTNTPRQEVRWSAALPQTLTTQ